VVLSNSPPQRQADQQVRSVEWREAKKDMKRKITVLALSAMLFALCSSVDAQQPKKVPRIGYLSNTDPDSDSARSAAIRLALRDLGYTEGQNIATEHQYAEGKVDRASELVAELCVSRLISSW
jgi:putative tryptophan/tyrosine transport system substrate-binding protein